MNWCARGTKIKAEVCKKLSVADFLLLWMLESLVKEFMKYSKAFYINEHILAVKQE